LQQKSTLGQALACAPAGDGMAGSSRSLTTTRC
jgi:hypothetical protein